MSHKATQHIGNYRTKDFFVFDNYGDGIPKDSLLTASEKHIGTVFQNKKPGIMRTKGYLILIRPKG